MTLQYLRISVTARCNLFCRYCRPSQGACRETHEEFTPEQFALLARCAAQEGVSKLRVTGGEPLLRHDLEEIISLISATPGIVETTLTTNAIGLEQRAAPLRVAGLDRINISLDTLRPERFLDISGQDRLAEVLAGIRASLQAFDRVKLNTVVLRDANDDELENLVRFAGQHPGLSIRFIEHYPSRDAAPYDQPILGAEVKQHLESVFGPLKRLPNKNNSVEETYEVPLDDTNQSARVGLIASASHPPCSLCNKLRFTAKGELRGCLFAHDGADLAPLLRQGDATGIRNAIRRAFDYKSRRQGPEPTDIVAQSINLVGG